MVLYHATYAAYLPSILSKGLGAEPCKTGLIPSQAMYISQPTKNALAILPKQQNWCRMGYTIRE